MATTEQILDAVCSHDSERAAAALQAAHGRGDELKPGIVARIQAAAAHPDEWDGEEYPDVGLLLFLAAEFRATAAHEPITHILRLSDDRAYSLLGDIITEQAPAILADTYPGTPAALLALVRDQAADPFARNAGLRALAALWKRGRYPRIDLLTLMAELAAMLDAHKENDALVGNGLVDAAMHIHAAELRGTILGLYERGLAEINYIEPEYAAKVLASSTPDPYESEYLDRTVTDAWQTVRGWPFFQPESPGASAGPPPPERGRTVGAARVDGEGRPIPFSAPPKVGRNDPCPCGSGKKFKKCCGG